MHFRGKNRGKDRLVTTQKVEVRRLFTTVPTHARGFSTPMFCSRSAEARTTLIRGSAMRTRGCQTAQLGVQNGRFVPYRQRRQRIWQVHLLKIMAAYHRSTRGVLRFKGQPIPLGSPGEARALGIESVYQDLAILDDMSQWQNF